MPLTSGTRLGPYEIISPIGAGGMGEVYKARDPRLERDVAIKILPPAFAQDPDRLARFEREAKAIAALSHPNILTVFDTGETSEMFAIQDQGGRPLPKSLYIVMELLEGDTLRGRLAGGPLPVRRAVEIGVQIAEGLAAAHDKGIVHRDLKPENVFVTDDGRAKILDFGLARTAPLAVSSASQTVLGADAGTTPGLIVGTMGYMAPEQVRGEPTDARTDIFAFGALLYELITRDKAFPGPTPADTMSAILNADPAEPHTRDGALPPTLNDLIRRCLEKSPARRFQSAHDLSFALSHALGSSASTMASVSAPAQAGAGAAPVARRGIGIGALAIVALVMLAAGAIAGRIWLAPGAAHRVPSFTALTIESGEESWPSLSPDGTSFLYVSGAAGHSDIYLRRIDGRNATNLTAESGVDNTTPAFSPDGRHIAFRSERQGGGLFVMEATGENAKRLVDQGYHPAWSPDGRSIAYGTELVRSPVARTGISQLWVVDVASGQSRKLADGDAMQPSWSPDGKHLVVWSVDGGRRVLKTIAADGGALTTLLPDRPEVTYWNPVWAPDAAIYFSSNESGVMTLGRVPVDAAGAATGPTEALVAPSPWIGQLALSRDGRRLAYQTQSTRYILWRAAFDPDKGTVGERTSILAGSLSVVAPTVSPDGRTVAFANSDTAGHEDIYVVDSDGRHLRQLTDDAARDRAPAWTPDGTRLVFYSNRGGRYEIWSMNPDGSDQRSIASAPDHDDWMFPRFSSTDQMSVAGLKAPVLFDATTWPPKITATLPLIEDRLMFWPYVWSPDGSAIAGFVSSPKEGVLADVAVYHPATGRYDRIPNAGQVAAWLPDGRRLLTTANRLYVLNLITGERTPATTDAGTSGTAQSIVAPFSAALDSSGRTVYYVQTTTDADIWLMSVNK